MPIVAAKAAWLAVALPAGDFRWLPRAQLAGSIDGPSMRACGAASGRSAVTNQSVSLSESTIPYKVVFLSFPPQDDASPRLPGCQHELLSFASLAVISRRLTPLLSVFVSIFFSLQLAIAS